MNVRPWLVGAVSVAAVTLGFGATASAATASHVLRAVHTKGFHVLSPSQMTPLLRHLTAGSINYNDAWAGYVAPANKNVALRYVAADFNVPSLNCANSPAGTGGPAGVAQAVGLDGWYSTVSGFESTGINAECQGTTPEYTGFYQLASTVVTSSVAVNPGDAIQASVYYNASTKQYSFVVNDVTTGQQVVNTSQFCPSGIDCANSSAEAVSGAEGVAPAVPLADYGMENFTGGAVTSRDGVHGGFGASKLWSSVELGMRDGSGVVMATPSSLEGGSAFNTLWHAEG